jgi:alkylmercury lyase
VESGAKMKRPGLAEIVQTLHKAGIPPQLSADQSRLLVKCWQLVAKAEPVSREQLKETLSELQMHPDDAHSFLKQVSEFDENGNLVGIAGLSQKKHSHRFQVNGRNLSTWCAWDTLFLPALLKHSAKVESFCPTTKSKILVTLSPDRVEGYQPANAVLSIVLPEPNSEGPKSAEEIWTVFCHYVFFFSSAEAIIEWFTGKDYDPIILSVEEGFQLGRMTFEEVLKYR